MLENLTIADFAQHLHTEFRIRLSDQTWYALELVSVTEAGERRSPDVRQPFSLVFQNPDKRAYLPQRTYSLEHPEMGRLEIFITPLGPNQEGMSYEAIFS